MILFTLLYLGLGAIVVALIGSLVHETAPRVVPAATTTPTGAPAT